ncbi:nipped-B-like protein isoform X2 [Halichondria panicea]|uniref:nipped-B-like protein isoform X2 n=1 Tax=Halichondria panicea TaxID=6063 RepID=UPI00312BC76E
MQSSPSQDDYRQSYPSLVGIAPLLDVLGDLPLPCGLPTSVERCALGTKGISADTRRLLNTTDPIITAKITEALLSVDCSFLDLKEPPPQTVPASPNMKAPPLIQAVMFNMQPVIKLDKIDPKCLQGTNLHKSHRPTQLGGWTNLADTSVSVVPASSAKKQKVNKQSKKRCIVSSSSESDKAVHAVQQRKQPQATKRRKLIVSIPRNLKRESGPNHLTVRLPRSRLSGVLPPPDYKKGEESGFTMIEGQSVPLEHQKFPKKKKKKHHHHSKHNSERDLKLAKFIRLLESSVDLSVGDELLTSLVVNKLAAEVFSLKQHRLLHEVPVDRLVGLLQVMDTHVLDSAQLLLHIPPEGVGYEPRMWREHSRDRVLRSCDAAICILHVATTPHIPNNVLVEESIEQIITVTKYHLENNIYPQFDFVYKMEYKDAAVAHTKKRRGGAGHSTDRDTLAVYHKLTVVLGDVAHLVESHPLTDATILNLTGLGIVPFFVENVSVLQLSALRLVRSIFSRYEKHRDLIIEEIFSSLAKLPTSKRNLRSFKLSNGGSIQMLTALVLQLVQCLVSPRDNSDGTELKGDELDLQLTTGYDLALSIANKFLTKFQKKCTGGKDEDDYRPLFENFVQDLLSTLNLPEWPASEAVLTLLARLLTRTFSVRSNEQSLRLTSIDHLGTIAARLRSDVMAGSERDAQEHIEILAQTLECQDDRKTPSPTEMRRMDAFADNMQQFQKCLIAYINRKSDTDPAYTYARDFYIAQWIYDSQVELEKLLKDPSTIDDLDAIDTAEITNSAMAMQQSETKISMLRSLLNPKKRNSLKRLEGVLDDKRAVVVTKSLASYRALSKSFDMYLRDFIRVLNDPAVHVRTRAMKSLSTIVAVDPGILSRLDVQKMIEIRGNDNSTLVREAAVDFVGRFILNRPELTLQYYDMLCQRIRRLTERMIQDSGVSVRKRVLKIFKDVCVLQPDCVKVDEICLTILKRIEFEEVSVKQMIVGVFREFWFSPPPISSETDSLLRRVTSITTVVGMWSEHEWFEQLVKPMLKSEDKAAVESLLCICQKMVDCLVQKVLTHDENVKGEKMDLVSCAKTLHLFCSLRPSLLLSHVSTLHHYLGSTTDAMVPLYMARILKDVVPLMDRPSPSFLAALEGNIVKIIMNYGPILIASGVECLGAIVNRVTHNYGLVHDCYARFTNCMNSMRVIRSTTPNDSHWQSHRGSLLRSIFTVGVMCKYFNMETVPVKEGTTRPSAKQVYSNLLYFIINGDKELQIKATQGLGLLTIRYPEMMLKPEVKKLYFEWLARDSDPAKKMQVLRNILNYLKEVETKLQMADTQATLSEVEKTDLLEFGDQHSSVSSSIAQTFLTPILEAMLHSDWAVRNGAIKSVVQIMHQGLVHPNQCVPYLIVMSTDNEAVTKSQADRELSEHTQRYGHLLQTQLTSGIKKSYELQQIIAGEVPRGFANDSVGSQLGLLGHVYTLLRSNKQHRRAFLRSLLRHFEDYECSIGFLLYLGDNLACLPYSTLEEPLFVVHHIDLTVSVTGSNLLQQFRETLGTVSTGPAHLDDEDIHSLSQQPCDLSQLIDCCRSSQGCVLLLLLKQHLKKCYGLSDSKCQKYSPTEPSKTYDKAVSRRSGVNFDPRQVMEEARCEWMGEKQTLKTKDDCLRQYTEFKDLMNKLDPFDEDGSDQETTRGPPTETRGPPTEQNRAHDSKEAVPVTRPEEVESTTRRLSRVSSASSLTSTSSHKSRGRRGSTSDRRVRPKKKRKIMISSDESDEDPDYYTR